MLTALQLLLRRQNIYGFAILRTVYRYDSGSYQIFIEWLSTTEVIYSAIDRLKKKIKDDGAIERDFPMLNVRETDSNRFETMIAICVNKEIKNEGNIFLSRMVPMQDKFLRTDVTGGLATIKHAHEAINDYMEDRFLSHQLSCLNLSHRQTGTIDTTKWKTTISIRACDTDSGKAFTELAFSASAGSP